MNGCGSSSPLADHCSDLSEHLQRRCAHHVAKQLKEVCILRVSTDHKCPLPERVEDRSATFDIGWRARGDDEQLARLGGIWIAEHRCRDIALSVPHVLAHQDRGRRGADRTHRQMDRAWHQTRCKTAKVIVVATKHDFAHGGVVRQHADNELAVEQIAHIGRRLETQCFELAHPIRASDIGEHPSSGGREVRCHCRSHVTETDKADFARDRPTDGRPRAASLFVRQIFEWASEGNRGTGFVLGHDSSWPGATARSDAQLATDTSRYLIANGFGACLGLPRS